MYIRPVGENEAPALIRAKDYAGAKAAYEDALKERPNSGFSLYGLARVRELSGDAAGARDAYNDISQSLVRLPIRLSLRSSMRTRSSTTPTSLPAKHDCEAPFWSNPSPKNCHPEDPRVRGPDRTTVRSGKRSEDLLPVSARFKSASFDSFLVKSHPRPARHNSLAICNRIRNNCPQHDFPFSRAFPDEPNP